MKRAIYLVYFCILLTALSWRLANAGPAQNRIEKISFSEAENNTDIVISMDNLVKPQARYIGANNCLTLDFPGTVVAPELTGNTFAGRDIKLAYLKEGVADGDLSRMRFYLKPHCLASLRFYDKGVIVRLSEKSVMLRPGNAESKLLLDPKESGYSPAVISLQDAPLEPVLRELAGQAGIDLTIAGKLPETFSLELEAASPFEALKTIAEVCRLRFVREGKTWILSGA